MRSTFSPSSVLYCDAGRDMYCRSDRAPGASTISTDPLFFAANVAWRPSRFKKVATLAGISSSASGSASNLSSSSSPSSSSSASVADAAETDVDVSVARVGATTIDRAHEPR
eukprot:31320-Pelagococcus_subviridis.AAC.4